MTNARVGTELYITATNEPGSLAKCSLWMQKAGINVEAFTGYEKDGNTAVFHFVTSDNDKAKEWFTKNGYTVSENQVVYWNANNTPGELFKGTSAIAEKKINISYSYGSAGTGNTSSWVIFYTSDNADTVSMLNNL